MRRLLFLIALLGGIGVASNAEAQWAGCGPGGYGYYGGYGYGYAYEDSSYWIPYFAAHPPVYYSGIVPRTYGYSPFAYPGTVMTPDIVVAPQPVSIENPHFKDSTPAPKTAEKTAQVRRQSQPLVIDNPFFEGSSAVAASKE